MFRYSSTREVVDHFKESTLIHAMPHTKNSPLGSFRKIWGIIFIIGMTALSYQFYLAFSTYYTFPIQVSMMMYSSRSLMFPSVTICNNNPVQKARIRCTHLDDMVKIQDKIDFDQHKLKLKELQLPSSDTDLPVSMTESPINDYGCSDETTVEFLNKRTESDCTCTNNNNRKIKKRDISNPNLLNSLPETTSSVPSVESDKMDEANSQKLIDISIDRKKRQHPMPPLSSTPPSEYFGVDLETIGQMNMSSSSYYRDLLRLVQLDVPDLSNLMIMASISEEDAQLFGYTANEFIMECSWDSTKCSPNEFQPFYNRRYGNCFTFNSGSEKQPKTAVRWGSDYGLRLTLNVNVSQYLGLLSHDSGVRVVFHEPGTHPFPETSGMSASPGFLTTVALSMTKIQRLPFPYPSRCRTDFPNEYIRFLPNNTKYTPISCQVACVHLVMFKECGCVDKLPLNNTYPQCQMKNETQLKCSSNVVNRQFSAATEKDSINCDCPSACNEVKYVTSVSQSKWPSLAYQMLKISNFLVNDPLAAFFLGRYNVSGNPAYYEFKEWVPDISVENNLVRFHTFYQDLNYQEVWEQASYPVERLFTDIGGIFGLYLGMSIAALFELIELLVMLIIVGCNKKKPTEENSLSKIESSAVSKIPPPILYPTISF